MGDVRASTVTLRSQLLDVDRELAAKGLAAPALAFGFSFTILFREGVEAVLLIAILLGSLAAGQVQGYKRPLGLGVLGAVVATAATWVVATVALDLAPVNRELLEAITALAAVAVLVLVSFWLVQRLEHRRRMEFMRARTAAAIAAGSSAAFAGLGFTAVYREGFETVLFYQALSLFAEGLASGSGSARPRPRPPSRRSPGPSCASARSSRSSRCCSPARAFCCCSASPSPATPCARCRRPTCSPSPPIHGGWARLPVFAAELTGIHPTVQGLVVQAALLACSSSAGPGSSPPRRCCGGGAHRRGQRGMTA